MKIKFSEISKTFEKEADNEAHMKKTTNLKDEVIKTFCRIRPIDTTNGGQLFKILNDEMKVLVINEDVLSPGLQSLNSSFTFTRIFDASIDQVEVFRQTCVPVIDDLFQLRKSSLIFAYGLTNAGKTYTITGDPQNPGVLPLSLVYIVEKLIHQKGEGVKIEAMCNFIEIYNEEVYDLLSDKGKKKIQIKEREKIFTLFNVTWKKIETVDDVSEALNSGIMKKTHAQTTLNQTSSRSHTIFKIKLNLDSNDISECSFSIVDLAGSERAYRAETSGKELQQACKINQSLSVLGKCLDAMRFNSIYNNKRLVPFRESKLTMLFQEYFQGEQSIVMITNINPSKEDFEESLRVLAYSCTAREIKPIKSRIVTYNPQMKKKEKLSSYLIGPPELSASENSGDESAYSANLMLNSTNNINYTNPFDLRKSYSMNANNNTHIPPTYTSDLYQQIEMLKLEFVNMCHKYDEHCERYEALERTNDFLLSQYKDLQAQLKIRELNVRIATAENVSRDNWTSLNSIFNAFGVNRNICQHSGITMLNPKFSIAASHENPIEKEVEVELDTKAHSNVVRAIISNESIKHDKTSESEVTNCTSFTAAGTSLGTMNTKSYDEEENANNPDEKDITNISSLDDEHSVKSKKKANKPKKSKKKTKQNTKKDSTTQNESSVILEESGDDTHSESLPPKKNKKREKLKQIEEEEKEEELEKAIIKKTKKKGGRMDRKEIHEEEKIEEEYITEAFYAAKEELSSEEDRKEKKSGKSKISANQHASKRGKSKKKK